MRAVEKNGLQHGNSLADFVSWTFLSSHCIYWWMDDYFVLFMVYGRCDASTY